MSIRPCRPLLHDLHRCILDLGAEGCAKVCNPFPLLGPSLAMQGILGCLAGPNRVDTCALLAWLACSLGDGHEINMIVASYLVW